MKEKPILFSGEMIIAILNGRKTQTRRVVKKQPVYDISGAIPEYRSTYDFLRLPNGGEFGPFRCPYGRPGDHLWVRETWQAQNQYGQWWHEVSPTERNRHTWAWTNPVQPSYADVPPRWLPSIHMPRRASRITLEIIGVGVERLQEINKSSARAEGITCPSCRGEHNGLCTCLPRFWELWDSINAKRGYSMKSNPWVWAVEFRRVL